MEAPNPKCQDSGSISYWTEKECENGVWNFIVVFAWFQLSELRALADPRGGARDARPPPPGSKFFHFHAVFGKNLKNNSNFRSWRTPLGKILDPPLKSTLKEDNHCLKMFCSSDIDRQFARSQNAMVFMLYQPIFHTSHRRAARFLVYPSVFFTLRSEELSLADTSHIEIGR